MGWADTTGVLMRREETETGPGRGPCDNRQTWSDDVCTSQGTFYLASQNHDQNQLPLTILVLS